MYRGITGGVLPDEFWEEVPAFVGSLGLMQSPAISVSLAALPFLYHATPPLALHRTTMVSVGAWSTHSCRRRWTRKSRLIMPVAITRVAVPFWRSRWGWSSNPSQSSNSPSSSAPFVHLPLPTRLLHNMSFRCRCSRGADVSWLSQYPGEREILFAPLTGLEVVGRRVEKRVLVVEVRLNVNLMALTIEQVVAKARCIQAKPNHSHAGLPPSVPLPTVIAWLRAALPPRCKDRTYRCYLP